MDFHNLNINTRLKDKANEYGFMNLTQIQKKCIPDILNGKDVVGQAETGSGKTLAFCLPILDIHDLVGFIDVKAHRKDKKLELISGYINKEVDTNFTYRFVKGVKLFAHFHNCSEITIGSFYPKKIKENLLKEIKTT